MEPAQRLRSTPGQMGRGLRHDGSVQPKEVAEPNLLEKPVLQPRPQTPNLQNPAKLGPAEPLRTRPAQMEPAQRHQPSVQETEAGEPNLREQPELQPRTQNPHLQEPAVLEPAPRLPILEAQAVAEHRPGQAPPQDSAAVEHKPLYQTFDSEAMMASAAERREALATAQPKAPH